MISSPRAARPGASRWSAAWVVACGVAALASCGSGDDGDSKVSRDPSAPTHVLLVSIDSLRADHLGCYGYDSATGAPTSPRLDALADEGVLFEQTVSTTSWTMPAHHSLLSGLPGLLHGAADDLHTASPDRLVLPEAFQQAGYDTAGFYSAPYLHPAFGFARGFETYENCGVASPFDYEPDERTTDPVQRLEVDSWQDISAHRVSDAALSYLRQHVDTARHEPFFLFLHYFDVHYDFEPPEERYAKAFWPDYRRPPINGTHFLDNPAIEPSMSPEALAGVISYYDGEIRWVDEQLGRVLDALRDLELEQDTLVVVVSDHGDEFFEHGRKGHRHNLYQETLAVPLILRLPGRQSAGTRVPERCSLIDVAPTLLDIAGVARPDDAVSIGRSLMPLVTREETGDRDAFGDLHVASGDRSNSWALWTGHHKVIVRADWPADGGRSSPERVVGEVYNLADDPGETQNLATSDDPAVLAAIQRYEESHAALFAQAGDLAAGPQPAADEAELARLHAKLEALGYLPPQKVSEQPPPLAFPRDG